MAEGKKQKENLNRFGQYTEALNAILGTNQVEMALRIEMDRTSLSYYSRNAAGPSKEIVTKLERAYLQMAQERHIVLPMAWDVFFRETLIEVSTNDGAFQMLAHLESWAALAKERNELKLEVERTRREQQRSGKRALLAENALLREEVHELRERLMMKEASGDTSV